MKQSVLPGAPRHSERLFGAYAQDAPLELTSIDTILVPQ